MTPNGQRQLAALRAPEPPTTRLVPAVVTPWTAQEVGQALVDAWTRLFGSGPTARSVAILLAQWALETGRGKSCFASNLGNARPPETRGDVLCCQLTRVSEVIEGVECFFAPPSRGSTFRAFESLEQGADFYLNLLHTRFAHAWPAVIAGDPQAYTIALHESHYFTASVEIYARTMGALFSEFLSIALMGSSAAPPVEVPPQLVSVAQQAHAAEWLATLDVDQSEFGASNIPAEFDEPTATDQEPNT